MWLCPYPVSRLGTRVAADVFLQDTCPSCHANFYPHIHFLVTERGTNQDGVFHHGSRFPDEAIQEIFTHKIFSLLLWKKLIGLPLLRNILHWRHTGFNVHSQVRAQIISEAERIGKYMIRPLMSLKRLIFDETGSKARYQYSRHGSQEESMDYLEFIPIRGLVVEKMTFISKADFVIKDSDIFVIIGEEKKIAKITK